MLRYALHDVLNAHLPSCPKTIRPLLSPPNHLRPCTANTKNGTARGWAAACSCSCSGTPGRVVGEDDAFLKNNRCLSLQLHEKNFPHQLHIWAGEAHKPTGWQHMVNLFL
jgi:enterochelin esterase-like enzyme